jgi:hypothetical protein
MKFKGIYAVASVALLLAALSFWVPTPALRAAGPSGLSLFQPAAVGSDPCQNPSITKTSASVAVTSATTTNLVSAVTSDYITVCKWQLTVVGTNPTIQFEYGTTASTACDTGATALTGAMAIPTTTIFTSNGSTDTSVRTPVSQQLCLVTGGSITGVEGYVTYVQALY